MRVDVERLNMEILLLQPTPPPQYDSLPQRFPAIDTESDEPGMPRWLPAIGTGSDEPGVSRAESGQQRGKECFLFKPVWMVLCASTAQDRSRSVFCFKQMSE